MRSMASQIHCAQYTAINCITSQVEQCPLTLPLVICFCVGEGWVFARMHMCAHMGGGTGVMLGIFQLILTEAESLHQTPRSATMASFSSWLDPGILQLHLLRLE